MIIGHICVEGWDYRQWSGVNLRQFLERVGADLEARYVTFRCADDYTEVSTWPPRCIRRRSSPPNTPEPITDPSDSPSLASATIGFPNPVGHRDRGDQRLVRRIEQARREVDRRTLDPTSG